MSRKVGIFAADFVDMVPSCSFMEFDFLGIFTLVTGVLFLIFEIKQSNWMWLFQFLSAAAAMASFFMEDLYASAALNLYYVVMAFVGFRQWRKDEGRLREAAESHSAQGSGEREEYLSEGNGGNELHLRRLGWKTLVLSTLLMIAGTSVLFFLLRFLGDPKSVADAGATVLSAIATWWLAKSYPQQWLLWIVADAVSAWICWEQGMMSMAILYIIYAISAIYGYYHWMQKGEYIES